jgi:hypothetical protein
MLHGERQKKKRRVSLLESAERGESLGLLSVLRSV